eukprot:TRINITY_DN11084_c0_g1_i1.p1 TRINITY_DN11084_c0_g1~~TRINITY_DN11084_c0_g1_i1.p1  ORF type:complete len:255 (-),score=25.48 TRINITY_DN11084_c0_g1_i1:543-1238(-)
MYEEAAQFAKWLITVEKDILAMQKFIEKYINHTHVFMQSFLPHVYEEKVPGQATPTSIEAGQVGQGIDLEQLALCPDELKMKMNTDVLQPLRNWLTAFNNNQRRMAQLESLRLEVDSRRRTAGKFGNRLDRARTVHYSKEAPSEFSEQKLEYQEERTKRKTAKANSAYHQYKEFEAETCNQLNDLIKDTVYLKQYMAEAMLILSECFGAAHQAFQGKGILKENRRIIPKAL